MQIQETLVHKFTDYETASSGLQHISIQKLFSDTVYADLPQTKGIEFRSSPNLDEREELHLELEPSLLNSLSTFTEERPFKELDTLQRRIIELHKMTLETLLLNACTTVSTEALTIDEYDELVSEHPWVLDFFKRSKEMTGVSEVSALYKVIRTLLNDGKVRDCDSFLKFIEPKEMSNVLLVGLLRLTNSYKDELRSWHTLKSKVQLELSRRGFDATRKLRGL